MKKNTIVTLVLSLMLNFGFSQTWADVSFPSTGARINDIKEAPNGDLYALSSQGLFKSTDNGTSWTERSSHVFGIEILTITPSGYILFEDGEYIMRLTPTNQIEYIDNYAALNTGTPKSASMVSFSNNNILMVKKGLVGWTNTTRTYFSTDEGATFTEISNNLPEPVNKTFGLARFHKHRNSDLVYYVGENDSVYKSTDLGQTFSAAGSNISFVSGFTPHFSVTASGDLYALATGAGGLRNIHKSTDQGATFPILNAAVDYSQTFYASDNNLYTIQFGSTMSGSTDNGATWTGLSSIFPLDDNGAPAIVNIPDASFMKSDGTFFCYYDGSRKSYSEPIVKVASDNLSTSNASAGIDMSIVSDASTNGTRLAASLSGWLHYSDDNGTTWNPLRGNGGWSNSACVTGNGTIYSISSLYSSGVFMQDAIDSTVEVFENGNPIYNGQDIFETSQGSIIVTTLSDIYYSTDGINFNISSNSLTALNGVYLWEDEATQRIYASTFETGNASFSDDEGVTWTTGTNPGSTANHMFKGIHGVWSATWPDGFYHSTDVQNWGTPLSTTTFINTNKDNVFEGTGGIYFAQEDARIYKSTDAFVTRTLLEDGIDSLLTPDFSSQTMGYFIPSTNFQGENGKLMLSVRGSLYLMDDGAVASLNEEQNLQFNLYPNPAINQITIQSDEELSNVQLFNLQGMKMNISINSGTIDISNLSNGVYILSVESNGHTLTKRFIKQ